MTEKDPQYLKWQIPEYRIPDRPKSWYIATFIFIGALLFSAFFTIENWQPIFLGHESNFLFVVVILLAVIIMAVNENRPPKLIDIKLDPEGITLGSKFYDYDNFRHFSVIYKPNESLKQLYLEFKSSVTPRLSIPLRSLDPLKIRNYLAKYLDEDLERTQPPFSEQLTNRLKL